MTRNLNNPCSMANSCLFGVPDNPAVCQSYRTPSQPGAFCNQMIVKTEYGIPNQTSFNPRRRFGVELEMIWSKEIGEQLLKDKIEEMGYNYIGDSSNYNHAVGRNAKTWEFSSDSSLSSTREKSFGTVELKSPVLFGFAGVEQLQKVMSVIAEDKLCYVNHSCGAHVHHEAVDLWTRNQWFPHNLYQLYYRFQPVIAYLVSPKRRTNDYCQELKTITECLRRCNRSICFPSPDADPGAKTSMLRQWRELLETMVRQGSYRRQSSLNLYSYVTRGTVEFRLHAGTTDGEKLTAWIILTQAILELAGTISEPIDAHIGQLSSINSLWKELGWVKTKDGLQIMARTYLTKRFKMFKEQQVQSGSGVLGEVQELGINETYGSGVYVSNSEVSVQLIPGPLRFANRNPTITDATMQNLRRLSPEEITAQVDQLCWDCAINGEITRTTDPRYERMQVLSAICTREQLAKLHAHTFSRALTINHRRCSCPICTERMSASTVSEIRGTVNRIIESLQIQGPITDPNGQRQSELNYVLAHCVPIDRTRLMHATSRDALSSCNCPDCVRRRTETSNLTDRNFTMPDNLFQTTLNTFCNELARNEVRPENEHGFLRTFTDLHANCRTMEQRERLHAHALNRPYEDNQEACGCRICSIRRSADLSNAVTECVEHSLGVLQRYPLASLTAGNREILDNALAQCLPAQRRQLHRAMEENTNVRFPVETSREGTNP
jgi:hypothetical protein